MKAKYSSWFNTVCLVLLLSCLNINAYEVYLHLGGESNYEDGLFTRSDINYVWDNVDGLFINPNLLSFLEAKGYRAAQLTNLTNRFKILQNSRRLPYIMELRPYSSTHKATNLDNWREYNEYDISALQWYDAGFNAPSIQFSYHHGAGAWGDAFDNSNYNETLSRLEIFSLTKNINFKLNDSQRKQGVFTRRPSRLNERYLHSLSSQYAVAGVMETGILSKFSDNTIFNIYCIRIAEAIKETISRGKKFVLLLPLNKEEGVSNSLIAQSLLMKVKARIGAEYIKSENLLLVPASYGGGSFYPESDPDTVSGVVAFLLRERETIEK